MLLCAAGLFAQITTSSMSGQVVDAAGVPLAGVAVVAVHTPSGTQYGAVSDVKGQFRLQNLRPGGPYTVKVQMLGYKSVEHRNITIALGDNYVLRAEMKEQSIDLDAVVVAATGNSIMNSDRNGSMTNVNTRELSTLPTTSRGVSDFTRLTPAAGTNNSFAGRDGKYNNLTIDGASFNQRFGLDTELPGKGHAQPISLDAIQEITVNLSPYDIRESSFTGASINAVTRSGGNQFTGSAYTYFQTKDMTGDKVGDKTVVNAKSSTKNNYGFTLGGPIIKDKLFFFANAEMEKATSPGVLWNPTSKNSHVDAGDRGDRATYRARTTTFDLEDMKTFLGTEFGYDPGVYQNYPDFGDENHKIVARLDWNINKKHKAMLRYNEVVGTYDALISTSGAPGTVNRYSADAIAFSNSNYQMQTTVRSITGELNSAFSEKLSNKFLVTYTYINDVRKSPSALFPTVDVYENNVPTAGQIDPNTGQPIKPSYVPYMTFGYEPFTFNNEVVNNTFTILDNVTYTLGDHQLLAGASFEFQSFGNAYQRFAQGNYTYNSMDEFKNYRNTAPAYFAMQYPYTTGEQPMSELDFGLASLYMQDEWQVNARLKLTGGVRFELPLCLNDLPSGTKMQDGRLFKDVTFENGAATYDMSQWPSNRLSVSPRIGFNWDIAGDRTVQLRGGTGLFLGYTPFVWYVNQPQASGFILAPQVTLNTNDIATYETNSGKEFRFMRNPADLVAAHPGLFPTARGTLPKNPELAKVADDFRLPKIWRSSLAVDVQLPWTTIFTAEVMYTRDVNAVVQRNANLKPEAGTFDGPDKRGVWWTDATTWITTKTKSPSNRINNDVSGMYILDNQESGKPYQFIFTAQLTKKFSNGLAGMVAYTYNKSKDLTNNPGSAAASAWRYNTSSGNLNDPGLGYSLFSVPHRVNGYVSYSISYANHLTSTFAVYYNGSNGLRLSYKYGNDINGDGQSTDLIYVPKSMDEMHFDDNGGYSAQQQKQDYWDFINNDSYLKTRKGKYAERGGGLSPWVNRFDFKFTQDIFANFGSSRRYTLQFTADVLNVGNLLNKEWGAVYGASVQSYNDFTLLNYTGVKEVDGVGAHVPHFMMNFSSSEDFKKGTKFNKTISTASTWSCLIGFRLKF